MIDVDAILEWMRGLPPAGVYAALWLTTYIENVFPPSPSDVVMLFLATLISLGTISFPMALFVATFGSVTGFLTAFFIGRQFGRRLIASGHAPFVSQEALDKVDHWFDKYGYWVIVVNRFMAGTRAVISFFAGMSKLDFATTTILCSVSALAWNFAVIGLGVFLGDNWELGRKILGQYGLVITILLAAAVIFFVVRKIVKKRKGKNKGTETKDHKDREESETA